MAFTTILSFQTHRNIHNQSWRASNDRRSFAIAAALDFEQAAMPLETSLNGITPIREFEPIVNVPAASAFVLIAVVFALLQLRINAVSTAAIRRSNALENLRRVESLQLSGDDSMRPNEADVAAAKDAYEWALREELNLRTIIPGVRIVAPNDPKRDEEQRAAAKRFLGWDSDQFDDDAEIKESGGIQQQASSNDGEGLSAGAQIMLFGVASILIVLLWAISFDPMSPTGSITSF